MRILLSLWISLLLPAVSLAQNLVPNYSFEEFSECPKSVTNSAYDLKIPGWTSPNKGTPDHFHRCANGAVDVPFNICGTSNPNTGQAYAGIFVWSEPEALGNYREYLQCELAEPLANGKKYKIGFSYKLASYSVYSTGRIGAAVSSQQLNFENDQVIEIEPALSVNRDTVLNKPSGNWEQVTITYTASGGEQFLVIGNFFNNENTPATKLPFKYGKSDHLNRSSYFFIDDVFVIPDEAGANLLTPLPFDQGSATTEVLYALTKLRFELDGALLFQSSYDELDALADYLLRNPTYGIRIYGHAFANRSDEFNQNLSTERAHAVAQYLVGKGVDTRRVISYGYGKSRLRSLEMTQEARKLNERVEIRFVTQ